MFKFINPSIIFIFLYSITGAIPYFESADKVHTQMLYLSIINLAGIYYIFNHFEGKSSEIINQFLKRKPIFIFFLFFLWSLITIFPSINKQESLIQATFYFQQLISFISILIFLDYNKKNLNQIFKIIIVGLTVIEVSTTLIPYISDIINTGQSVYRSLLYRGITGSLNILAFSLCIKLPILSYYLHKSKNLKWFFYTLIVVALFVIFSITKTRGALIFILLSYPFLFIFHGYFLNKYHNNKIRLSFFKSFIVVLSPLILSLLLSNLAINIYEPNSQTIQDRVVDSASDDYSTNSRLRYYKGAIESILENPLFGIGTGNWELVGTKKDWKDIEGYTVPYHVHNDYLEIMAENGILGGILYFFVIFYIVFKLINNLIRKIKSNNDFFFDLVIILSISAYLFDALLNFPSARPLMQINLFILLSFSMVYLGQDIKTIKWKFINNHRQYILFIILLLPLSCYSSLRIFKSSIEQKIILQYYNTGKTDIDKYFLDNIELNYPSLSTTSVPLKAFKAYFYLKNNYLEESIKLFNESTSLNPYVYFSEGWRSYAHYVSGQIDSARYYAQIAYDKIPNNLVHFGHLAYALVGEKDSIALKELYQKHEKKMQEHTDIYLLGMSQIIDQDTEGFALDDIVFETTGDKFQMIGYYSLKVGYDNTIEAAKLHLLGEYAFNEKDFNTALEYFNKASSLNPYEIPYRENLANTYSQLDKNEKAIEIINDIEKEGPLTNKARYTRALSYLSLNNFSEACKDFKILQNNSYIPDSLYINFCSN